MRIFVNLDAGEGSFFLEELEHLKSRQYNVQYTELMARRLFPVDSSAPAGAESIGYDTWDMVGQAQLLHSYAVDLPNVEVKVKRSSRMVYGEGLSFGYSVQDVRNAQMAGKPLNDRKAAATRRQMLSLENKLAFYGNDATKGVPGVDFEGFINNSMVNVVTIADGAGGTTDWDSKTPDEILDDVQNMVSTVMDFTRGIENPNTLLLPPRQYAYISSTPRSSVSDTTILSFLLASNAWITEVIPVYELRDAAPASNSYDSQDCMILYDRSPEKLTLEIPQDVEFFPPQENGLYYKVPVHARTAGVIIYYPKSIAQGNGI
ncbi:MAG: DUF2184 domain-containing protein [Betaproteobacteria bacterium]|nr:MAG: DUF2184 domain-containing protein [Betaproteobacteria bacterium]